MTGSAARSSKILGTLPVAVAPAAAPVAGRSPLPLHCRRRRTVGRDGAPCRHGRRAPCSGDSPAPAVAPPRSGWSVAAAGPRPHRWWPAASRSAAGCNAPGARTRDVVSTRATNTLHVDRTLAETPQCCPHHRIATVEPPPAGTTPKCFRMAFISCGRRAWCGRQLSHSLDIPWGCFPEKPESPPERREHSDRAALPLPLRLSRWRARCVACPLRLTYLRDHRPQPLRRQLWYHNHALPALPQPARRRPHPCGAGPNRGRGWLLLVSLRRLSRPGGCPPRTGLRHVSLKKT